MKNTGLVTGAPCWVELSTSDTQAATAFYGTVFGWRAEVDPRPEAGGYATFSLGEAPVAGLVQRPDPEQPTAWTISFAVHGADETAAAVTEAGGSALMEPMDVLDLGRFAILADPSGAVFSIWQAREFAGAGLINEPGSLGWAELQTRDPVGSVAFYHRVFGWSITHGEMYTQFGLEGADFGGMAVMGEQFPPEVPPHWLPYFSVADVDATVSAAATAGAEVLMPPTAMPEGPRIAVLRDPQGAVFGVYLAGSET
ncbi:VOC family protein [Kitasatospora nipponensis]|uniref:VOC family protein n=1 Tax=Kitasatospora nipponensis TaxID=258049 RepID=A0ABN1WSB1_9ACTN